LISTAHVGTQLTSRLKKKFDELTNANKITEAECQQLRADSQKTDKELEAAANDAKNVTTLQNIVDQLHSQLDEHKKTIEKTKQQEKVSSADRVSP
jgi:predicted RNase H-like nuclease (RuvC/YqgF family)